MDQPTTSTYCIACFRSNYWFQLKTRIEQECIRRFQFQFQIEHNCILILNSVVISGKGLAACLLKKKNVTEICQTFSGRKYQKQEMTFVYPACSSVTEQSSSRKQGRGDYHLTFGVTSARRHFFSLQSILNLIVSLGCYL